MDERTDVTAETNDALQAGITDRKRAEVVQRENEEQPRLAPDNLARRDRRVLLDTVLLSLAIFLAVCLAPVRHSVWPILVWPFYLIPLLLTGLTREPRYPPILAALCTVLVVVGFFSLRRDSIHWQRSSATPSALVFCGAQRCCWCGAFGRGK